MKGIIYKNNTKEEYLVLGIKKADDGSGIEVEFIAEDANDPKGKVVQKVFLPKLMADTLAKKILE